MGALLLHPPYHSYFFTVTIHRRRTVAISFAWIVLFCKRNEVSQEPCPCQPNPRHASATIHPHPAPVAVAVGASQRQTVEVGPSRPTGPLGRCSSFCAAAAAPAASHNQTEPRAAHGCSPPPHRQRSRAYPAPHTTVASVLSSRVEPITLAMHSRSTPCPCSLHCHTHSSLNSSVLSQHGMNGRVAHHSTTTVSDSASFCHTRTAYLGHLTCTAVTPARRNLGASFVHILCPHRRCLP